MKIFYKWANVLLFILMIGISLCACGNIAAGSGLENSEDGTATEKTDDSTNAEGGSKLENIANQYALATAEYPEMSAYPIPENYIKNDGSFDSDGYDKAYEEWEKDFSALQEDLPEEFTGALSDFTVKTMAELLKSDNNENRVYSPLNLYMALSMLAELTDGNSRGQLLTLLEAYDVDSLRSNVNALWKNSYRNDGILTNLLANSIWLDQDMKYISSTMKTLADSYYVSSYQGPMGDESYNHTLQQWMNENTGNLLEQQVGKRSMEPNTVLMLASTIYFKAAWLESFDKEFNTENIFYGPENDITCTFMNESSNGTYYWGDDFSAVKRGFNEGGAMWLILPDKDSSEEKLLENAQVIDMISDSENWKNRKEMTIHLSVPKFDVSSDSDIRDSLKKMGITDIFDRNLSDFSPMTEEADNIAVSQALHAARVKIDEEGCEATAFTVINAEATGMLPENLEEITMIFDHPFLFIITNRDGQPEFIGVVKEP